MCCFYFKEIRAYLEFVFETRLLPFHAVPRKQGINYTDSIIGIYAVDKIAKASINRNDSQAQHTCQRCGYTNGSGQSVWSPGPAPRGGPQNDYMYGGYGGYQDQRQFNPSSDNQRGFLPSNQQRAGFTPADFDDGKRYIDAQYQQMQGGTATPPPYNQQK